MINQATSAFYTDFVMISKKRLSREIYEFYQGLKPFLFMDNA